LTMYTFNYRSARFSSDIPLQFAGKCGEICGTCTQLSHGGLLVAFADSPLPGELGRVRMTYGGQAVNLEAQIAHVSRGRCGMKFLYKSEHEKQIMDDFIVLLGQRASNPRR